MTLDELLYCLNNPEWKKYEFKEARNALPDTIYSLDISPCDVWSFYPTLF
jgi:hypothetical protein